MVFSSLEFLFLFLPVALGGYFILPRLARNGWLLATSLVFYAWGEPTFVFAMVASIVFNYVVARGIAVCRMGSWTARLLLTAGVGGNLALLGTYKYANFLTGVLRGWFPSLQGVVPQTSFLLPIGISFFTFQALSYVVDVFRGRVEVQRNPFTLALYIALFPQLIAGPIVRYADVYRQLAARRETWAGIVSGLERFLVGFNKKVLLANTLAVVADRAFAEPVAGCPFAWLGAVAFSLQVYFDFSGYSDMAIGLGRMFGFTFPENFDHPYAAGTICGFWRRWHMSLTSWFRDYVYFPLGGSRVGPARQVFNLLAVWALTGLWHGAEWTFIIWGLLWGLLIVFEKLTGIERRLLNAGACARVAYRVFTVAAIIVCPVFIRAVSLPAALSYLSSLAGLAHAPESVDQAVFWLREDWFVFIAALVGSLPVWRGLRGPRWTRLGFLVQLPLFVVSLVALVMKAHNPFMYFNF